MAARTEIDDRQYRTDDHGIYRRLVVWGSSGKILLEIHAPFNSVVFQHGTVGEAIGQAVAIATDRSET